MAKTWTTKDGRKIKHKDIEDDHLLNILKMLIRNAQRSLSFDNILMFFSDPPDDVADHQFDMTWGDYLNDAYYDLYDEYVGRGLDATVLDEYGRKVENRGLTLELKFLAKKLDS